MKVKPFVFVFALIVTGLMIPILLSAIPPKGKGPVKKMMAQDMVERGRYLVTVGGCNDCHTPKKMTDKGPIPDPDRLLCGHPADAKLAPYPKDMISPTGWLAATNSDMTAWAGPWGISFAFNLTPDLETGLGSWNEEMFINSMRTGKHMGVGRDILPPMPWPSIALMTDDDLKAVFAYLKSLKPIKNAVPDPVPPPQP